MSPNQYGVDEKYLLSLSTELPSYFMILIKHLTLKWPRGVPRDPTFVFCAFYYFRLRFLTVIFSYCLTIGYASFDAKNFLNRFRRFLAN